MWALLENQELDGYKWAKTKGREARFEILADEKSLEGFEWKLKLTPIIINIQNWQKYIENLDYCPI